MDGGGNASGQGEYTPYGGTVGTELNTPYAWQGQSGLSHEREPGLYIIGVPDAPPYVPAAPTYTAPYQFHDTNPYQPMNANPASYGPQDEGDDDPFPVDENGRALPYQPMRRGLHQLRLLFNTATNEFGVVTSNGYIRTYFIPDPAKHGFPTNLDYFLAQ